MSKALILPLTHSKYFRISQIKNINLSTISFQRKTRKKLPFPGNSYLKWALQSQKLIESLFCKSTCKESNWTNYQGFPKSLPLHSIKAPTGNLNGMVLQNHSPENQLLNVWTLFNILVDKLQLSLVCSSIGWSESKGPISYTGKLPIFAGWWLIT